MVQRVQEEFPYGKDPPKVPGKTVNLNASKLMAVNHGFGPKTVFVHSTPTSHNAK